MISKQPNSILLLIILVAHHAYIALVDTTNIHNLHILNIEIWSAILLLFLSISLIGLLHSIHDQTITIQQYIIYISLFPLFGLGILQVLGIGFRNQFFNLLLVLISASLLTGFSSKNYRIVKGYQILLILNILLNLARLSYFREVLVSIIGPIFEISLLICLYAYYTHIKMDSDRELILPLVFLVSFTIGLFLSTLNLPGLILSVLFQQTLGLNSYSVLGIIPTNLFLALHLAEIITLLYLVNRNKRSIPAITILISGFDLTYPPLILMRHIAVLLFINNLEKESSTPL